MLIQLQNEKPVGSAVLEENFRMLFPETSFPSALTPSDVAPFGYGLYEFTPQPEPGTYEKVIEVTPIKNVSGIWMQAWAVVAMTPEEVAIKNEEMRQQTKQQAIYLLSQTDWVELSDVSDPNNPPWLTNKTEFTVYRAALRLIVLNPPVTVTEWPVKPDEQWSA